jgi:hypothetical protein
VSTKFVQIKALGFKLAPLRGAYIQVSDFRAIVALLFIFIVDIYVRVYVWIGNDLSGNRFLLLVIIIKGKKQ